MMKHVKLVPALVCIALGLAPAVSLAQPGQVNYSSPGSGNSSHLAAELFNSNIRSELKKWGDVVKMAGIKAE